MYTRVLGQYKQAIPHVKVVGAYKPILNIFTKINGIYKAMYNYTWSVGSWGDCSASCGGGTQTRAVTCTRIIGGGGFQSTISDNYCTASGLSKPVDSQACNTQSCAPACIYDQSTAYFSAQDGNKNWVCMHPDFGQVATTSPYYYGGHTYTAGAVTEIRRIIMLVMYRYEICKS